MTRRPLYEKNETYRRTVNDTITERDLGYARLIDVNNHKSVEMFWDFDPKATEDGIFRLKVGKEDVFLDAEQFRKYLRWV